METYRRATGASFAVWETDRPVLDLPAPKGWKAELTLMLVIYRNGLPVCRQSPIKVVNACSLGVEPTTSRS